ncbi:MAG: hypothetical protein A2Z75_02860 [Chloroflexi bacterium RBG_13_50_10]|nr:MAG: hypothetical protein A2Z75_02860 [Chloroflexi bacterium RBG_13_50_10]
MTKEKLARILRCYRKSKISDVRLKSSAVLMPIFCSEGQYHILFTERSEEVNFHKGQVCFPGGGPQRQDANLLQTALREAEEEINLRAKDVEIMGELDDCITHHSGYVITPFVAFIPYPYPFELNTREVEEIFSVPLSAFTGETNIRYGYHPPEADSASDFAYEYEGHVIWGATARILKRFSELLRSKSGALD